MFDENGNIAEGITDCDLPCIEVGFVDNFKTSSTRSKVFDMYMNYLRDIVEILGVSWDQLIGGSFTTSKMNPGDIDFVNFIEASPLYMLKDVAYKFMTREEGEDSRSIYGVDAYLVPLYPSDNPKYHTITLPRTEYWLSFLSKDKFENDRGIIRVEIRPYSDLT